jgi:hypothetical protein
MDCTFDGYIDGEPVDGFLAQPVIELDSASPLAPQADDELFVRLAAEQWGMAWNRWIIVTTSGGGTLHFEGINADRLHPQAGVGSPLIDEIGGLLGDDGWSSGIDYESEPGVCQQDISCGAEPRAVRAETLEGMETLQASESGYVDLPGDGPLVLVSVLAAREYPNDVCDDVPLAWYAVGAIPVVQ